MNENKSQSEINDFNALRIALILLKKKSLIIWTVILATLISVAIALILPKWYLSTVNCVPPKRTDEGGIMNTVSSTLKNIGLTKLTGKGSNDTYSFLVILQSRTVVDSLINLFKLDKVYEIPKSQMILLRETFLENVYVGYEKEGNFTISVLDKNPQRAANIANKYIEIANSIAVDLAREEARLQTEHLEQRLDVTNEQIKKLTKLLQTFSKKYGVFSPEDQAKNFSSALAELKLQQLKYETYYDLTKKQYGESDPKTIEFKSLLNKIESQLDDVQNKPGFAGNFSVNNAASVGLEFIYLSADLEANTKLKTILIPMLEDARLDQVKNIENLYVLDKAIPADKKDRPRRALIVAGSAIGSLILIIFIIIFIDSIGLLKRKLNEFKDI